MTAALVAIPLLPIAAALACWALPRSSRLAGILAALAPALAIALLVIVPSDLRASVTWMSVGGLDASLGLRCDGLARALALFVAAICTAVNLYAIAYLADDPRRGRFFGWMAAFAGAMLALVLADSLLLLFIAWEMVGVASLALIAFHHRDRVARRAAHRAFLVTRTGDLAFLFALAIVWASTGTTELDALARVVADGQISAVALSAVALALVVAALAKSAQLPLSAWLPGAMVAPTPVSALLHSATMVAAGVFLVARVWPVFEHVAVARTLLACLGAATAVLGALVATGASNLKRLLAWSTISQLGEMMLVLGLASPGAAVFHLVTHGLFKAALFVVAGSLDERAGSLELEKLGGLLRQAPWLAASFAIAALALAGLPPLAGYYSSEAMLGTAAAAGPVWAAILCTNLFLAGAYVSRAFGAALLSWPRAPRPELAPARPMSYLGLAPLVIGAALAGLVFREPLLNALSFAKPASPSHGWSLVALAASVAGITVGLARVLRRGPVPTFAASLRVLERATDRALTLPARAVTYLATAAPPIEAGLDAIARSLPRAAMAAARASKPSEASLDRSARASAELTVRAASTVDRVERDGLGAGLDRAAASLGRAADALRSLQTGLIFHYAMTLFVWTLIAGLVAALLWS